MSLPREPNRSLRLPILASLFVGTMALTPAPAAAASFAPMAIGRDWWLPPDFSVHGHSIDRLFIAIFWLTMIAFVLVQAALVYFLIRYRFNPHKAKAVFTHGNTRLEMIWTLIPAVIFIWIALATKTVWDNYRYPASASSPDLVKVMVIGQQFKWNVIYPGPDGKFGRYLMYPKTSDLSWPALAPGDTYQFPPVPGPAYLPEDQARTVLNQYIDSKNPLGKDFSDPDGLDDDYRDALARAIEIPKGRPIEVTISSKDVIHDFFLPNYRVKLDAVPGMRGQVYFTATRSSEELEKPTRRRYSLDEIARLISPPSNVVMNILVGPDSPKAFHEKRGHRDWLYKDENGTIIRNDTVIPAAPDQTTHKTVVDQLRAIGVTEVDAYVPQFWDLVCEQLCGAGHYTMQGKLFVREPEAWDKKFGAHKTAAAPAAGAVAIAGAAR